jgi:hypothetical protein
MTMTAAMAAALTVLGEALNDPELDVAESLTLLTKHAAAAVPSYRGLTVVVPQSDPSLTVTTLADDTTNAAHIRTSLQLSLPGVTEPRSTSAVAIILYAGSPGAFVDLAADMAWLTARPLDDFALDQHLTFATRPRSEQDHHASSAINQAVGVLIGRGYTPQQADGELDTQAANSQIGRPEVARRILAAIPPGGDDGCLDLP